MAKRGVLSEARRRAIVAEPLVIARQRRTAPFEAGHFVDWVLAGLPAAQRRGGGVLETTLELSLQTELERAVAEHVASLAGRDVTEAGVLVLDTATGSVRAMVGSRAYAEAAINITTRRRQLGSLLKPFVYALAIEAGESPASVALDIGDVSDEYRARDWVGREAGPLSYREALGGSYNLAAVHVLERVGVSALHARLRSAGVAELSAPPARYGLPLALGSARVRLLDVAAGYGFLVRGGQVRAPRAIERLTRPDGSSWRPPDPGERSVFTPAASWLVMDMLSDPSARHRRFGRGLPLGELDAAPVVAKTGTASGLSDLSAVLASRELIVAAWVGRFDGQPTRGSSGMWSAAPLAARAMSTALRGRAPSLPSRPAEARRSAPPLAAAVGGGLVQPDQLPRELEPWAERARALPAR
jgi:penicillin-binding protein 1C